jgi:hypothetical protein
MAFSPRRWLFALFVCFSLSPVFALEFTGEAALTPFQPPGRGVENIFDALHLWGNLQLTHDFSPGVGFDIRAEHDPILLKRVILRAGYQTHYLAVNLGPFLGVLNGDKSGPFPGLSLSLETVFPGVFFASLRLDSTIGRRQWETGDYTQELILARTGFWLPNTIIRLEYSARFFAEKALPEDYRNEWTRLEFSVDFFRKNVPFRILIKTGYEHVSWTPAKSPDPAYMLQAFYAGFEPHFQFHPSFELSLGAEIPVYSWTPGSPAGNPAPDGGLGFLNLSTFTLGFNWAFR